MCKHLKPEMTEAKLVKKLAHKFEENIKIAFIMREIDTAEKLLLLLAQWQDIVPTTPSTYKTSPTTQNKIFVLTKSVKLIVIKVNFIHKKIQTLTAGKQEPGCSRINANNNNNNDRTANLPLPEHLKAADAKAKIERATRKRADKYNVSHRTTQFQVGEKVLVRANPVGKSLDNTAKKFFRLYDEPYTLSEKVGKNTFMVFDAQRNKTLGKYHSSAFRKYYARHK